MNDYAIQEKLPTKKQGSRNSVFYSVYRVDDTDIPIITGLDNRKNN